ncbi:MAG TPA: prepilin-type N-terminal cleavage/methylation domain-containing protein [Methylophilaceae bacterium]|nr:prepilin-type N-terminal cleavage/methylation domain-containing protein [Methylophilaceae bacterium]
MNRKLYVHSKSGRLFCDPSRPTILNKGFSLIELSIVLCIVGFLMLGILKGTELYHSAKVKRMANELSSLTIALYVFQDKYKALPGDDANASGHFNAPLLNNGNGNLRIDGNWFDSGSTSEASQAWLHLRLAGLENGSTSPDDPSYMPRNFSGGFIGLQSGTSDSSRSPIVSAAGKPIDGQYIVCSRGISGKVALGVDTMLDDGDPASGKIMATPDRESYALGAVAATSNISSTTDLNLGGAYIVCAGL